LGCAKPVKLPLNKDLKPKDLKTVWWIRLSLFDVPAKDLERFGLSLSVGRGSMADDLQKKWAI